MKGLDSDDTLSPDSELLLRWSAANDPEGVHTADTPPPFWPFWALAVLAGVALIAAGALIA